MGQKIVISGGGIAGLTADVAAAGRGPAGPDPWGNAFRALGAVGL